ncbi:MAG: hypothetical protein K6T83_13885 [Alicyclobacillus sp.]|nr:hypothetical protein [Alicyclobacillus sp.]
MYHELLTVKGFETKLKPRLQEQEVRCALCGRTFRRLSATHLNTHADFLLPRRGTKWIRKSKATIEAERQIDPNEPIDPWTQRPETLSETYARLFGPLNLLDALVEQTFRLYSPRRDEWTLMEHLPNKAQWLTITPASTGWPWPTNHLTKFRLKEHFQGRHTVGIKAKTNSWTNVIVFDVDSTPRSYGSSSDVEARAKHTTRALVRVMKKQGFEPHVSASGGKGYHISLFFHPRIRWTEARNLYHYFVNHPDVPLDEVQVECLPMGRAVKLPLGLHWGTGKFCTFVDPLTLIPVTDPYEYFLGIRPMSRKVIDEFVKEKEAQQPRRRKTHMGVSWSAQATEVAFKIGIEAPGTRHNTTLRAAAYLLHHMNPQTFQEFFGFLIQWSQAQYQENHKNIRTAWLAHYQDARRIAKYVWEHRFTGGLRIAVDFRAGDVHWIRSQTPNLATQRLLLAALYQYRIVSGPFYFGFARMQQLTGLAKDSLCEAIRELRERRGILKMIENYSHRTGLGKSKTTKYTLTQVPDSKGMDSVLVTVTSDTWSQNLWYDLLVRVCTKEQLRKDYPFAYHRILREHGERLA